VVRAALCVAFPIGLFWSVVSATSRSLQDSLLRTAVVYDWAAGVPAQRSSSPGEGATGPPT
jgi:type III secretory pathway component EscT